MRGKIALILLLESLGYRWREEWQRSVFPRFFKWWITELVACAPASWRESLNRRCKPRQLIWPLKAPWNIPSGARVDLVLTAGEAWSCELELPKQTANNLRPVVSYELDKHIPFTRDQVYFDVKAKSAEQPGMLQVMLVIIDRPRLNKVLDDAKALGIEVESVDVLDTSGRPMRLNLIPHSTQTSAGRRLRQTRYALCAAIALILISIPATLITKREQRLEIMRLELADLRSQAMEVDDMRKQLLARDETEKALNLQSSRHQTILALLENLTACVNHDTWLDHLEIRSDQVINLSGMSLNASDLPSLLMRCANLQKAAFQGGVQFDSESGMDRFSVTATRHMESDK